MSTNDNYLSLEICSISIIDHVMTIILLKI